MRSSSQRKFILLNKFVGKCCCNAVNKTNEDILPIQWSVMKWVPEVESINWRWHVGRNSGVKHLELQSNRYRTMLTARYASVMNNSEWHPATSIIPIEHQSIYRHCCEQDRYNSLAWLLSTIGSFRLSWNTFNIVPTTKGLLINHTIYSTSDIRNQNAVSNIDINLLLRF